MGELEWIHAAIGVVATAIFLFQTFWGANNEVDSGGDFDAGDADLSGSGIGFWQYLSIRNFVAFFVGYGWVTLAALLSGTARITALLLGICAGLLLVCISIYIMRMFMKFQESGTLNIESLVGKQAVVYIAVTGGASGTGKVMIDTAGGRMELQARTDDPDVIRPGRMAKILRTEGGVLWITAKDEKNVEK